MIERRMAPHQCTVFWIYGSNGVVVGDGVEERSFGTRIRLLEESGIVFREADQGMMKVNVICVILEYCGDGRNECGQGESSMKTHRADVVDSNERVPRLLSTGGWMDWRC